MDINYNFHEFWKNILIKLSYHCAAPDARANLWKSFKCVKIKDVVYFTIFIAATLSINDSIPVCIALLIFGSNFVCMDFTTRCETFPENLFQNIDFSILWLEYDWMLKTNQNAFGFMTIFQAILKTILFFWNSRGMDYRKSTTQVIITDIWHPVNQKRPWPNLQ